MLIWLILTPVLASLLIGICKAPTRATALCSATITLLLGIWAVSCYDPECACWSSAFGYNTSLTLAPALAKVMVLLTVIVTFATILGVKAPETGKASWYIAPLLISAGASGAFLSYHMLSFFAFHELALIPTFVMIGLYGRLDKRTIAWRATLYLAAASMVLLAGLIMLGIQTGFRFSQIANFNGTLQYGCAIGACLLVGFGTLVSLFPFHSWAAPAYASAPTPVAMMHAGVLKKFGLYGLLMLLPALSQCFTCWNEILLICLVGNVMWVGYVTVNQKRLDMMLGNSSVMHMGYLFLGIAVLIASGTNAWAFKGAALLMLAHGLSIAMLFLICGQIEAKTKTLELGALGGLGQKLPKLCFLFGLAAMASIGLPGLANFPGEFMIFFSGFSNITADSIFTPVAIATICCLWGLVISAVYMLRAYRAIFLGDESRSSGRVTGGLTKSDYAASIFLAVTLILFGFFPNIITQLF